MGVNFFMLPKKRNDFSDPEHMEAMPLSYKGEEDFFFPYFLEWLDPSSYLLGKWFRLDEDQEMSGKRTTERHFPGSEMPIPDVHSQSFLPLTLYVIFLTLWSDVQC